MMPITATPPATDMPTMEPMLRPPLSELPPPVWVGEAEVDDEVVVTVTVTSDPLISFVVNCEGEEGGG
jgi:hypothetical protein